MNTVRVHTYSEVFEVPEKWLLENTKAKSVQEFQDTYTWDEGEWLQILYQTDVRDFNIGILETQLKEGHRLFKNEDQTQEGLVHDSTKFKGFQFSYFDSLGAVGDLQTDTLDEMAAKLYDNGFDVCSLGHTKII